MDEHTVRDAVADCRGDLVRLALRYLDTREAAEDAVQEALLRLVTRTGPAPDSARAWLMRVTRNAAVDRLRRLHLERAPHSSDYNASATPEGGDARRHSPAPDEELERDERRRAAVRALLAGSGPRDVATVLLREVFGTDYAELARTSGRSDAACRQTVHRALGRARARAGEPPLPSDDADGALERFERALRHENPAPLFEALRVSTPHDRGVANGARLAPRPPSVSLRVEAAAGRVRLSLVLDGIVLCALPARGDGRRTAATP